MRTIPLFFIFLFVMFRITDAQNKVQNNSNLNYLSIVKCEHDNLISSEFIENYNSLKVPTTFFKPSEILGLNNSSKIIFTYNNKGLVTSEEYYESDSSGLNLSYKWLYTYTSNGKILTASFIPNNGSCTNLITYEYDNIGQLIRITKKNCDNDFDKYEYTYYDNKKMKDSYYYMKLGNWVAKSGSIYEYDNNLNLITKTNLSEKENTLAYSSKSTFTYSPINLQLTILEQSYTNYNWTDSKYYTFEYDSLSQLVHKIESIKVNNNWNEEYHYYYLYNQNGSLLKYTQKRWVPNAWILNYQELYTYDENQYLLTKISQVGDGLGNGINELKTNRTYNILGQITSNVLSRYNSGSWKILDSTIYEYDDNLNCIKAANYGIENGNYVPTYNILDIYYNQSSEYLSIYSNYAAISYILINNVSENDFFANSFSLENNYPNPFNPSTTISFNIPKTDYVSLKIFDCIGKEVATLINQELVAGKHSIIWNADKNASGIYFYKLSSGKYTITKKMCLIK